MIASANDTLVLDAPVVRGTKVTPTPDRTKDLMRIVRHALKASAALSPLDRAIRSAAGGAQCQSTTGSVALASEDADSRARQLARRMNALLARRATRPSADPHCETVRG
jgi:hypothetical protein